MHISSPKPSKYFDPKIYVDRLKIVLIVINIFRYKNRPVKRREKITGKKPEVLLFIFEGVFLSILKKKKIKLKRQIFLKILNDENKALRDKKVRNLNLYA